MRKLFLIMPVLALVGSGSLASCGFFVDAETQSDIGEAATINNDVEEVTSKNVSSVNNVDTSFKTNNSSMQESYSVIWVVDNKMYQSSVKQGEMPEFNLVPEKAGNDKYSYNFTGWQPEVSAATKDIVYYAQFEEVAAKYNVVFKMQDEVIQNSEYEYNQVPTYNGDMINEENIVVINSRKYLFNGWEPEISPVKNDQEYNAKLTEIIEGKGIDHPDLTPDEDEDEDMQMVGVTYFAWTNQDSFGTIYTKLQMGFDMELYYLEGENILSKLEYTGYGLDKKFITVDVNGENIEFARDIDKDTTIFKPLTSKKIK